MRPAGQARVCQVNRGQGTEVQAQGSEWEPQFRCGLGWTH